MKKRVLLLAVSCKPGGLCPGGIDLDNPSQWIRIVNNDGHAGAVQGYEIDFAEPLDTIEFEGRPMPQGKQRENWVIDYNSCRKVPRPRKYAFLSESDLLKQLYNDYGYHGFWNNYISYLNEDQFNAVNDPSESILKVTEARIYKNNWDKAKIDFTWNGHTICGISLTDQDYYDRIRNGNEVHYNDAYIVISIPKSIDDWKMPDTGERRAYKFVSKVFGETCIKTTNTDHNDRFKSPVNGSTDDLPCYPNLSLGINARQF